MQITRDQMIAGVSAMQLRDAFRRDDYWTARELAERFAGSDGERLAEELLALGYLERVEESGGEPDYRTTSQALALSLATARKPIKRATAEKLLSEFLDRAKQINSNEKYLYTITKVVAFGSLLTDSPTLGDLDLAIEMKPRITNGNQMTEAAIAYADAAAREGRRFSTFMAKLTWAVEDILQVLKNRSPSISLHFTSDGVLETAEQRVLFAL